MNFNTIIWLGLIKDYGLGKNKDVTEMTNVSQVR